MGKKKGLFCCDWPIYMDSEGNYYDITLTNDVLERYLKVVDELSIIIRVRPVEDISLIKNYSKISNDKVRIIACPNPLTLNGMLFGRREINQLISEEINTTDLIFVRIPSFIGNIAIDIAKMQGKPYLVEIGGCAWDSYWYHGLKGKLIAPFFYLATRKAVKSAPFAVYVTSKFLQRRYPCSGVTEACTNVVLRRQEDQILINRYTKIAAMQPWNKEMSIVIGTVAAVNVKYKGQQYVIDAISRLNNQGYNFEYHLVGSGDNNYLKELAIKKGVAHKVKFLGVMKHNEVLQWLESIDIYAQPSKQEGLPRALIEAMSTGCPSIGSTTAGIPELLSEDVIFRNGDVTEICEKLKYLLNGEMKRQALVNFENAKQYVDEVIERRRLNIFQEFAEATGDSK